MSILDKLLKNTNTTEDNKLKETVENVQSVFEESESEKEASVRAVNAAIEEIKNNPQMPIGEFLSKLQKNTDLKDIKYLNNKSILFKLAISSRLKNPFSI